jgi:serine/threonine-protein kinase RsbW
MSHATVRLTMPAKAEYLILARLALAGIAREAALSEPVLADLKLAVTEACGNVVRHAYPDEAGEVRVVFDVRAGSIDVSVEDRGAGGLAPGPAESSADDGDLVESGMGLAIIRAVMDELTVESEPGRGGTVVRMRKLTA